MILLVDNYDSFTYNLAHYLADVGGEAKVIRNDEMSAEEALALKPDAIVLSPGPCTPNEAGICMDIVKMAPDNLPILGVCLGHQSIGQALGGDIVTAREIRHGKLSTIHQTGGALFEGLPSDFEVVRYHSLALDPPKLPDTLIADATTDDGEIMAVHHVSRPVFGLQFHPESIRTEHGHAMLKNFLKQIAK
ncbi:aminodeoxychorismate/anthranilate synthase component II [Ponticaulis sp.]|uniref:anthranilate synthase component II n=1 Tax=Ponticaulis sp. TaxID=2020902 RepID=UPI000B75AFA5|nr:aminodeoxychorismate/anthranilate synthase component II [Ponticaulis sp.]MAI89425.1 aminodeoxychorismate/anthranilate synthase component II [Ponticaulis sp.]OUY00463.1 MAG: aminodeoxychorismate/anthranilate synthase component II [Hyphomonadaceae bacterium TMED5]|tara:strand:+ start:71547 stop:72119 length:573 start_codon:yes stop_codon:yes gene_type:complete